MMQGSCRTLQGRNPSRAMDGTCPRIASVKPAVIKTRQSVISRMMAAWQGAMTRPARFFLVRILLCRNPSASPETAICNEPPPLRFAVLRGFQLICPIRICI